MGRPHLAGTEPLDVQRFVDESQARARADARRFVKQAGRFALWSLCAFVGSWALPPLWFVCVALGIAAVWFFGRAIAENRVSQVGLESTVSQD